MSKRFKAEKYVKLDETLASNITDLIRNGMNEEQCLMIISYQR